MKGGTSAHEALGRFPRSLNPTPYVLDTPVYIWLTTGSHLLQRRERDKGNKWGISVIGHAAVRETPTVTAARETTQRLGLTYTPDEFMLTGTLVRRALHMEAGKRTENHFVLVDRDLSEETLDSLVPEPELFRLYDIDQLESDLTLPRTRAEHVAWPISVWVGGIMAMREAAG